MRTTIFLFIFILTAADLSAQSNDKKWIPIQPMPMNETPKLDNNKSKVQSGTQMIQNLAVIKNLLDHVKNDGQSAENVKNWYSFEPSEE